jgi:hypothetical protein
LGARDPNLFTVTWKVGIAVKVTAHITNQLISSARNEGMSNGVLGNDRYRDCNTHDQAADIQTCTVAMERNSMCLPKSSGTHRVFSNLSRATISNGVRRLEAI